MEYLIKTVATPLKYRIAPIDGGNGWSMTLDLPGNPTFQVCGEAARDEDSARELLLDWANDYVGAASQLQAQEAAPQEHLVAAPLPSSD